jgi:hypothetical protein
MKMILDWMSANPVLTILIVAAICSVPIAIWGPAR